jgi:hypothetical protein
MKAMRQYWSCSDDDYKEGSRLQYREKEEIKRDDYK